MSSFDNLDDALDNACKHEAAMVAEADPAERAKCRRRANLYFKKAMKLDGNENFAEDVLQAA